MKYSLEPRKKDMLNDMAFWNLLENLEINMVED